MSEKEVETINIDLLAAKHAQIIIREKQDIENTITKSLGVLQENGVYACFLYLLAKEKDNGKIVVKEMLKLLEGLKFGEPPREVDNPQLLLDFVINNVALDIEKLFLAKEALEQMLIYARYGAKACK